MKLWSHSAAQRHQGGTLELEGVGTAEFHWQDGTLVFDSLEALRSDAEEVMKLYLKDEQQALSRRYGSTALVVVPLSSGRIAIFGNDRQLISICPDCPTKEELQRWSAEAAERTKTAVSAVAAGVKATSLKAEDFF